jgi:cytochrome c553
MRRVLSSLPLSLLLFVSLSTVALAADVEAGKAKVAQLCAECHRASDWNGESRAALESLIKDVVAGKLAHSKRTLQITEQDAENIAAYWVSGRK